MGSERGQVERGQGEVRPEALTSINVFKFNNGTMQGETKLLSSMGVQATRSRDERAPLLGIFSISALRSAVAEGYCANSIADLKLLSEFNGALNSFRDGGVSFSLSYTDSSGKSSRVFSLPLENGRLPIGKYSIGVVGSARGFSITVSTLEDSGQYNVTLTRFGSGWPKPQKPEGSIDQQILVGFAGDLEAARKSVGPTAKDLSQALVSGIADLQKLGVTTQAEASEFTRRAKFKPDMGTFPSF